MLGDPALLEAVWSVMTTCEKAGMLGSMLERWLQLLEYEEKAR